MSILFRDVVRAEGMKNKKQQSMEVEASRSWATDIHGSSARAVGGFWRISSLSFVCMVEGASGHDRRWWRCGGSGM